MIFFSFKRLNYVIKDENPFWMIDVGPEFEIYVYWMTWNNNIEAYSGP